MPRILLSVHWEGCDLGQEGGVETVDHVFTKLMDVFVKGPLHSSSTLSTTQAFSLSPCLSGSMVHRVTNGTFEELNDSSFNNLYCQN